MANDKMMAQISVKDGFIAALDQSGGSTPSALRLYGIPNSAYSGDAEMFRLMHEMRVRIMAAPAFTAAKVIAAILFEGTMDGQAQEKPVPTFLWEVRGVIPFLKVDKGLEAEKDGVSLMKPMPALDALLTRAVKLGVFGTKMRSFIKLPSKDGIAAVVEQQFDVAAQIATLANAAMLPLMGSVVTMRSARWATVLIAACIVVPQLVVAVSSPWIGRRAQIWGRRPLLLIGFAALPIRGILFASVTNPELLVIVQLLDGVTAAVFSVLVPLVVADLRAETSRSQD